MNAKKVVFNHDVGTVPLADLPVFITFNVAVVAHMANLNATILCTTVKTCKFHSFYNHYFGHVPIIALFCFLGGSLWSTDSDESAVTVNWDIDDLSFVYTSLENVLLCEKDIFRSNAHALQRIVEACHSIPAKRGNRRFAYDRTDTARMFYLKALQAGDELGNLVYGMPLYVGLHENGGDYGVQHCKSRTPIQENWHQQPPEVKPFCFRI